MTVPNEELVAKVNAIAEKQRRLEQTLGTDYLSRQSVPGAGHLPVGSGSRALDLLPPDQPNGSVLVLDSLHRLGVRWVEGGGGEVDSDANGNVFEGPGALAGSSGEQNVAVGVDALGAGTNSPRFSVAVGYEAMANVSGINSQDVAVGYQALNVADTASVGDFVAVGFYAMGGNILLSGGSGGGVAIGSGANSDVAVPGPPHNLATDFVAIGKNAAATGRTSIAVGVGATALAIGAITVGGVASGVFASAWGKNTGATAAGATAIGTDSSGVGAASAVTDLIVLGTAMHTTRIPGIPAFVSGDKYLVVNASGDVHKSALGPAS